MVLFRYRAADHSGRPIEGTIEADTEQRVVSRLHEMGFIPLRIFSPGETAARGHQATFPGLSFKRVSQRELLYFTRGLSTLLGAGLPLDRGLSVLGNLVEGEELRRVVRLLLEGVRAGRPLSAAMAEHPDVFPILYVNMVKAGESGGILDVVLISLVEYLERSSDLREDLRSALTYPLLLATVTGLSIFVLFIYVIPKFSLIFKDVHAALPLATIILIEFSRLLSGYWWIVGILFFAAAMAGRIYLRNPEGKLQWDRVQLRIWILGDLLCKLEVARFARTMAALLKGGVPLLDALGTVQGVVGNSIFAKGLAEVQVKMKEGKGMAGPLTESRIFPTLALQMIAVGEETGKLEGMLAGVADYYEQEAKRTIKRLTSMLEPALILSMGLVVGGVVISMLMAIFSIHDLPF